MNSEEPFTSVNWDRNETQHANPQNTETPILEEPPADFAAPPQESNASDEPLSYPTEMPLDCSSTRSEIAPENGATSDAPNLAASPSIGPENDGLTAAAFVPDSESVQNSAAKDWPLYAENEFSTSGISQPNSEKESSPIPGPEHLPLPMFAASEEAHKEAPTAREPDTETSENRAQPSENRSTASENRVETSGFESSLMPHTSGSDQDQQHSYVPSPAAAQNMATPEISGQQQMEDAFARYHISSRVSDPISDRDGNSKSYISYLVTSETNHPDILRLSAATNPPSRSPSPMPEQSLVKVRRRYGDFRFLHDCLVSDFPQLLVPPLPAKSNFKYLMGDTFSTPFVHKRLHSLDRFITFICQHKLLSQSSVFHYFVSDSTEWATFTKNLKILKGEDGDSSLVGKVVNEDLLAETIMNYFTASKHKKETNKDIIEISEKLKKLYENLVKLERIFAKLNKKNSDMKHDYESFSTQINKMAALHELPNRPETAPSEPNASFASSIGTSQPGVPSNFKIFADSLLYFSENWASLGAYIDESFLVSLKDCAKYIARLSGLIELHHNKKIDLQVLEEYLAKARADMASFGGSPGHADPGHRAPPNPSLIGPSSGGIVSNTTQLIKDTLSTSATPHIGSSQIESKKHKLQQKIQHLETEVAAQTQLVDSLTNRIIHEEYPNWDRFNKMQMKKSMADLCDQEISFYKGLADNWTDVEAKLVQRLDELK